MKIKLRWNLVLSPSEATEEARERFKRIKKRLKAMTPDDLSMLIMNAVDRDLDRTIGFKTIGFKR